MQEPMRFSFDIEGLWEEWSGNKYYGRDEVKAPAAGGAA
jgi:hypothetical protein